MGIALTDDEFWKLMRGTLGFHHSVLLIGWCAVWSITGAPSFPEIEFVDRGASRTSAYRALADLRKVGVALAKAEGRDSSVIGRESLYQIARRIDGLSGSARASGGILARS